MAGSNYVLDKGFPVLSTYNSSSASGVQAFRGVKVATTGTIDLAVDAVATSGNVGVVQENVDATKVATGKVIADVRLMGISKVIVGVATGITIGKRVMIGTGGAAILAATAGSSVLGIVVGTDPSAGTIAANDLIDVLLTPGAQFA
jgi:hypothetical protein